MTSQPSPRILLDLSYGALGYSGIPQETRLLLKALRARADVEANGLIFGVSNAALNHRLTRTDTPDRHVENQADILFHLIHGNPAAASGGLRQRLVNAWSAARTSWRVLFGRRGRLEELDTEVFWDVFWRRWLALTLSESDRPLARAPVHLSDISTLMMTARVRLGLPAPRLDTKGFDFALFHEARAVKVDRGTCKIVRHYDLIPVVRPDLVGSVQHVRRHIRSVRRCETDSIFTCISESAREDLVRLFPGLAERAVTIPCALADGYYPEHMPRLLPGIIAARSTSTVPAPAVKRLERSGMPPYILMVSTIEPRKNYVSLVRAYEQVIARNRTDLRLIIVGNPGWLFQESLQAMAPQVRAGRLFHLDKVPQAELRVLYTHAEAVVFPSLYEGFGYTPLEAMCCGTAAIASDIAAHKWAYGDAAEYCDPYSVDSISAAIERVALGFEGGLRAELIARGYRRVERYRVGAVGEQWHALLTELQRQGITHNVQDARLGDFNEHLRQIERDQERLSGFTGLRVAAA